MPRPPLTHTQKDRIRKLFLEGHTSGEIAKLMDIHQSVAVRLKPLSVKMKERKKQNDNLNKTRVHGDSSFIE